MIPGCRFLTAAFNSTKPYIDFLQSHGRPADALSIADVSRAQTLERGLSSSSSGVRRNAANAVSKSQDIAAARTPLSCSTGSVKTAPTSG